MPTPHRNTNGSIFPDDFDLVDNGEQRSQLWNRFAMFPEMQTVTFPDVRFQGQLRPSQAEVVAIARRKLEAGKRRLHIVAPPGAGKTVLGLYLWAECIRCPALVLSPNSAIQAQWAARANLFAVNGRPIDGPEFVSTSSASPALLTSLTYQSVTLPSRADGNVNLMATARWVDRLIEQDHADSPEAANQWINDLKHRSPTYFEKRLSSWRKQARDELALQGQSLEMLHQSARQTLQRLRDAGVGVVILDECHHLMGHWGRVLAAANEVLDGPVVIGLTATPPDREGQRAKDIERYDDYFGPIDYEVPVPAVVRDGFLAPYQDLVWFVQPTASELEFVVDVDVNFRQLLDELCVPRPHANEDAVPPLDEWLFNALNELRLPAATCRNWSEFERRDPEFAEAARVFLNATNRDLPQHVPPVNGLFERLFLRPNQSVADLPTEVLTTVLDRYIRHGLRRSRHEEDQRLCEAAIERLRLLGTQVTETGSRACVSPVSRILGYTHSKVEALVPILTSELDQMEDDLRAVVITDYEKTSAVSADVSHVLNEEAGGAVAAFRRLASHPATNTLDPILLTGSTILIDYDLAPLFEAAANHWLHENGCDVELEFQDEQHFYVVKGSGADWCPRVYIQMVTQLFQDGVTRCLVGTRGLLGEGWDANRINVLIDLTTVATSMTVNQLRGRSIRLDPRQPQKVANNWDIVCVAPDFARGMDDYHRFCKKHRTIYGVTDDGAIEKGVGHVHAALTEVNVNHLAKSIPAINADMIRRSTQRQEARALWKIGTPFEATAVTVTEIWVSPEGLGSGFAPFLDHRTKPWDALSLIDAISSVLLKSLRDTNQLKSHPIVRLAERHGGYVRVHLEDCEEEDSDSFTKCLTELTSPFQRPRYLVPFHANVVIRQAMTGWIPGIVGRFFESREPQLIMYCAVPAQLSRNKALVEIFEGHWNNLVSDGEAIYAQQGNGLEIVEKARRDGMMPEVHAQQRECFQ